MTSGLPYPKVNEMALFERNKVSLAIRNQGWLSLGLRYNQIVLAQDRRYVMDQCVSLNWQKQPLDGTK